MKNSKHPTLRGEKNSSDELFKRTVTELLPHTKIVKLCFLRMNEEKTSYWNKVALCHISYQLSLFPLQFSKHKINVCFGWADGERIPGAFYAYSFERKKRKIGRKYKIFSLYKPTAVSYFQIRFKLNFSLFFLSRKSGFRTKWTKVIWNQIFKNFSNELECSAFMRLLEKAKFFHWKAK